MQISEFFKIAVLLLFVQCYPAPRVAGQFTEIEFDEMATQMADGKVRDLSTAQVANLNEKVVLLDTRELAEYQTSHIPNAVWVGYEDFSIKRIPNLPKETFIVTYCSVGYRSERIGEQLQELGYTSVYNLKGSIFQWVNEKRTIVDEQGKPTNKVHGYNKKWSKWVKHGEVAY